MPRSQAARLIAASALAASARSVIRPRVSHSLAEFFGVGFPGKFPKEATMKIYFTVAASMAVGIVLGGFAVQGLHAQAKPPVYLINEIDVTDPEKYGAEFTPKAQATVRASGAKFLVIGGTAGAGAKPIHAVEGTPPKRMTIQVWESVEAMKKWYDSPEYQEALKIGHKYATFRRYAVEGQ